MWYLCKVIEEPLILEPEDYSSDEWATVLKIFGMEKAQRIVVSNYKFEAYGKPGKGLNVKLEDVLLYETKVGDLVLIRDCGWQIGCTIIDHEDLFVRSLDNRMLNKEVKSFRYESQDWTSKDVMIVDI